MATLDELLRDLPPIDYLHELQFAIDENLRTIAIPNKGVIAGVVGDKDVNRVNFVMPRIYNGFDMSVFEISVYFYNANSEHYYYTVNDMTIEDDRLLFSWLISAEATAYPGETRFIVRLVRYSGVTIEQAFNSTEAKLTVLPGMDKFDNILPIPDDKQYLFDKLAELENKIANFEVPAKTYDITDLRRFTYVGRYFSVPNGGYNDYSSAYLATNEAIRLLAGSSIRCKATNVQYRIFYKYDDADTWIGIGPISTDFVFEKNGQARFTFNYSNKRALYNDSVLDYFDIHFKMEYEPKRFHRNVKLMDIDCPTIDHFPNADTSGFDQMTDYKTIIKAFDDLAAKHNRFLTKRLIPMSDLTDSQIVSSSVTMPSYEFVAGIDPPIQNVQSRQLPTFIFICSMHGSEKSATYSMYYLLKELLENPTSSPILMWIRTHINIVVMPSANPYGWDHNNRLNESGININRNFAAYEWDKYLPTTIDGSGNEVPTYEPGGYDAKGAAPCDQEETRMITKFVKRFGYGVALIDLHNYGTNTSTSQEVCAFRVSSYVETLDKTKEYQRILIDWARMIKPFMDSAYDVNQDYAYYGTRMVAPHRPSLSDTGPEIIGIMSYLLELPAGGPFLGPNLTKYSPNTIRLGGELIAATIMHILKYHKFYGLIN